MSSKQVADRTWHPDMVSSETTASEPPRPEQPPAKEGAPAVVTPGGPGALPRIDVEWYLAQQILPPIARLCEPVAGMSRASIVRDRAALPFAASFKRTASPTLRKISRKGARRRRGASASGPPQPAPRRRRHEMSASGPRRHRDDPPPPPPPPWNVGAATP